MSATKKMAVKDVCDLFKKFTNGDKLATRLMEEYHAKKIVCIPAEKYDLKEDNSKEKVNAEELSNALSYTDFFRISPAVNDANTNYYVVTVPTNDDFSIKNSNTTMYNLEVVQENCVHTFAKSVLVKKQDKNKPAFMRTCLFDHATMVVFE